MTLLKFPVYRKDKHERIQVVICSKLCSPTGIYSRNKCTCRKWLDFALVCSFRINSVKPCFHYFFLLNFSHWTLNHLHPHPGISWLCYLLFLLPPVFPVASIPSHSSNDSTQCFLSWTLGHELADPFWSSQQTQLIDPIRIYKSNLLTWKFGFPSDPWPHPLRPG